MREEKFSEAGVERVSKCQSVIQNRCALTRITTPYFVELFLAWVLFCVDTDPCFCYSKIQFLLLTTITPLPPLPRDQNAEKLFAQERLLRSPEAGMYECYRKFLKYEKKGKKILYLVSGYMSRF